MMGGSYRSRYPNARVLLGNAFYEFEWDEAYLDPDEALAAGLAVLTDALGTTDRDPVLAELRDMSALPVDQLDRALIELGAEPYAREGAEGAWWDYLVSVVERGPMPDLLADLDRRENRLPRPPRTSRYFNLVESHRAWPLVLDANEALLQQWLSGQTGFKRLSLYAELPRPYGSVTVDGRTDNAPSAVVLMRMDPATREPKVATSYPEIRLDPGWRKDYPDLPHLFGGHFGLDWSTIDETVWRAEVNFHVGASPAAQGRVAEQLDRLLAATRDEVLPAAVTALGGYVLPGALRPWLERVRRRMDLPELWGRAS